MAKKRKGNRQRKSAVHVLRAIKCEGMTAHSLAILSSYSRRHLPKKTSEKLTRIRKEFGEWAATLSESEKLLMGRFIGFLRKESFDIGLKMGMAARIAAPIEDDRPESV